MMFSLEGVSSGGLSVDITDAINAAVTKALLEQSGNGRPNLKENLLNIKVRFFVSFKLIEMSFRCSTTR